MRLKVFAVVLLAVGIVGSMFVIPVAEAAPPQPHNFYGFARDSGGLALPSGGRITTFIDGVDYSNATFIYNAAGAYDVDVHGNWMTSLFEPNTPEVMEGGGIADAVMFVQGDMTTTGRVFTANRPWGLPTPGTAEPLDITLAVNQPLALLKVRSITVRPADLGTQYIYVGNPSGSSVDLTTGNYFLQKDTSGGFSGPRHPLTGASPGVVGPGGIACVDLTSWDIGGTTLAPTGDTLKLVWDNPGGSGFGGSDVIVDRVEYNQTAGGLIYQIGEPTNTIMSDAAMSPLLGREIRRNAAFDDTNNNFNDFSDQVETGRCGVNTQPSVTLLSPVGGEDWTGGTLHTISWWMDDAEDSFLDYVVEFNDGVSGYVPIGSGSGVAVNPPPLPPLTLNWPVPSIDILDAMVRVCVVDSGGLSACDPSGPFIIDSTGPDITVTTPPDLDPSASVDTDIVINFDEGMNQGPTTPAVTIVPPIGTDNRFWDPGPPYTMLTINPDLPLASFQLYTVTVGCAARDDSDTGNAPQGCPLNPPSFSFTTGGVINNPPLATLMTPSGGEVWSGGSQHDITWTMIDTESATLWWWLNYSTNGGVSYPNVIASGSGPDGPQTQTHTWNPVACVNELDARVQLQVSDGTLGATRSSPNFEIDCTAPTVVSVFPANLASEVPITQNVVVRFSEAMDTDATNGSISFSRPTTGLVFTWSQTTVPRDTVTISHNDFTRCPPPYVVQISTLATDDSDPGMALGAAYSWEFTTVCAPTVTVTTPAGGERWTCGTPHAIGFTLSETVPNAWVNLSLNGGADGFSTLLDGPVSRLAGTTTITENMPSQDTSNAMIRVQAADATFLVGSGTSAAFTIDCTPPEVLSSDPANAQANVPLTGVFTITFSEDMDPTSACTAVTVSPAAWTGSAACTWPTPDVLQVSHDKLRAGRSYTLTVGTGALDASDPGLNLDPQYTATFTTTATTGLTAVVTGPATAETGTQVTFDGTGSDPAPGAVITYTWEVRNPSGATVSNASGGETFPRTFDAAGTWTIVLWVTDAAGNSASDQVTIEITAGGQIDFFSQYWWLLLIVIIAVIGGLLFFLLGRRRKKEPEEMPEAVPPESVETVPPAAPRAAPPAAGTSAGKPATKECKNCGTILKATDSECFMCGAAV